MSSDGLTHDTEVAEPPEIPRSGRAVGHRKTRAAEARHRSPRAARPVHLRWAVEVDPLDVGPGHVLGALTAVEEDQHAGILLA